MAEFNTISFSPHTTCYADGTFCAIGNRKCSTKSRSELEMIDKCERVLHDGKKKDVLEKLRLLCLVRGEHGIVSLGRLLRRMDVRKGLSLDKFILSLHSNNINLTTEEATELFDRFDKDNSDTIDATEFLEQLRPPMSQNRIHIIDECFRKLDKSCTGIVTINDLRYLYSVLQHPQYESGEQSKEQITNRFLANFAGRALVDGCVTQEEFFNYYAGVSASIEDDTYFDLLLREAYKL